MDLESNSIHICHTNQLVSFGRQYVLVITHNHSSLLSTKELKKLRLDDARSKLQLGDILDYHPEPTPMEWTADLKTVSEEVRKLREKTITKTIRATIVGEVAEFVDKEQDELQQRGIAGCF